MTEQTKPTNAYTVPSVSIATAHTGASSKANELGMRTMQERAYAKRGEQFLLIKSPPASGKSRALMFIALDKLHNQGLQQAIVVVPERSIGGSFADEPLSQQGFYWDWQVAPQWNLCNAPGIDEPRVAKSKVQAVRTFLASTDKTLVCTHATFRFAVEELGLEAFDNRLIAIDEFHHVSANPDNKLGSQLSALISRDKVHLVAMTGSYFRGDSEAVLAPSEENKFETVTYTYYEQLNGYRWLKSLDIGYFFYTGKYVDAVAKVLDPTLKTIIHIPNVNARESLKDKEREVNEIMSALGEWQGVDPATGFHLIKTGDGRTLKVADLVDDSDAARRSRVLNALKDPAQKNNRDHVDVIIALGMAKEGFDWIWCEHALTIGYRSSLTEIVQIIGRATRDAIGKERSRFTNLIAEPMADQAAVAEAVNDMLKAISASLLMEQVLAPRYEFTPKDNGPKEGFTYGPEGYLKSVNDTIARALEKAPCTKGNAYLTAESFKNSCITPELNRRKNEIRETFTAPTEELGDGGRLEDKGRQAVRALLVPSVAMALSLIFSLVALLNLGFKLISPLKFARHIVFKTACVAALITAPAFMLAGKHGAVADLIFPESRALGPALKWVITMEPAIYSFGKVVPMEIHAVAKVGTWLTSPVNHIADLIESR